MTTRRFRRWFADRRALLRELEELADRLTTTEQDWRRTLEVCTELRRRLRRRDRQAERAQAERARAERLHHLATTLREAYALSRSDESPLIASSGRELAELIEAPGATSEPTP